MREVRLTPRPRPVGAQIIAAVIRGAAAGLIGWALLRREMPTGASSCYFFDDGCPDLGRPQLTVGSWTAIGVATAAATALAVLPPRLPGRRTAAAAVVPSKLRGRRTAAASEMPPGRRTAAAAEVPPRLPGHRTAAAAEARRPAGPQRARVAAVGALALLSFLALTLAIPVRYGRIPVGLPAYAPIGLLALVFAVVMPETLWRLAVWRRAAGVALVAVAVGTAAGFLGSVWNDHVARDELRALDTPVFLPAQPGWHDQYVQISWQAPWMLRVTQVPDGASTAPPTMPAVPRGTPMPNAASAAGPRLDIAVAKAPDRFLCHADCSLANDGDARLRASFVCWSDCVPDGPDRWLGHQPYDKSMSLFVRRGSTLIILSSSADDINALRRAADALRPPDLSALGMDLSD